ncbi:MAG: M1 family metallopeptidase, partial [Clostridiales bacterium]|nr:M1 family metallopeptidase [Clostridiales bacterium]MDY5726821.1 M1 family metallopeptidase [Eubacteriales bacterium]
NINLVSASKGARAYKNGYSYGGITIDYVKNGEDVPFSIGGVDSNVLIVPLSKGVKDGQKTQVEISFGTTLANIWHRLGYGDNTVNLTDWFPVLCVYDGQKGEFLQDPYCHYGDPFVMNVANYRISVTFPDEYVVAAGGDLVNSTTADGCTRYEFCALSVRDFAIIASKNFEVLSESTDGVTVNLYYFADKAPNDTLKLATAALKYFSDTFGGYPYTTLSVVESDFCEGGMEYPRLVMVTSGLEEKSYKNAVVHEIAHQWWCCLVGNDQIRNAWMDEGLAEYSTNAFFGANPGFGIDAKGEMAAAKANLNGFLDITGNYFKDIDTSMCRALGEYRNETEYAYMCYVKSMIMFDDLKTLMGKTKFNRALKKYFETCRLTIATPEQLVKSFSDAYGSDLTKVITGYVEGKENTIA